MKVPVAVVSVLATLLLTVLAATQAANVSGRWALDAPAAEGESPSGGNWQLSAKSGVLTLEQKGDFVTGSWQGTLPEPWALTGRVDGSKFDLQSEVRDLPAVRNGVQTTVPRRLIFRGTADGDRLTGSMSLAGADDNSPTQPFTAVRKK